MTIKPVWIFGYGSLIWKPGFDYAERKRALLTGYRRRFCMTSVHYRGTPEVPGLVLALDRDPAGSCEGVAYRLAEANCDAALAYLRERELVSYAYHEMVLPLRLEDGASVEAIAYVVNRDHAQYSGVLDLADQARIIARAVGPMGSNLDYLDQTVASLEALEIADDELSALRALVSDIPRPDPPEPR